MAGIDAGDEARRHGDTIHFPSDGSGSAGDAVKMDGSGQVTPTTANGDEIVGILSEDSPSSSGNDVVVHVHGAVYANADGSVTAGELLQPSGSTNGHVVSSDSNEGLVTAVDEGATDTYDVYTKYAMALEDASDGELVPVLLS